jgi:photosystem I reaction center subunit XII
MITDSQVLIALALALLASLLALQLGRTLYL